MSILGDILNNVSEQVYTLREIPSFPKMNRFAANTNVLHVFANAYDSLYQIGADGDLILNTGTINSETGVVDSLTIEERIRVLESTGYVGINDSSPDYQLDVAGSIQCQQDVRIRSSLPYMQFIDTSAGNFTSTLTQTSNNFIIKQEGQPDAFVLTLPSGDLVLSGDIDAVNAGFTTATVGTLDVTSSLDMNLNNISDINSLDVHASSDFNNTDLNNVNRLNSSNVDTDSLDVRGSSDFHGNNINNVNSIDVQNDVDLGDEIVWGSGDWRVGQGIGGSLGGATGYLAFYTPVNGIGVVGQFGWGGGGELIVRNINVTNSKNFRIWHPNDNKKSKGYMLQHASVEAPEVALMYRGSGVVSNGKCVIQMPSYYNYLVSAGTETLHLTKKSSKDVWIENEDYINGQFSVTGEEGAEFNWMLYVVRKGFEDYAVEFIPEGDASVLD